MKMLKRSLALTLALIMMISAVPFTAFASESTDVPSEPTEAVVDAPAGETPAADEAAEEAPAADEAAEETPAADEAAEEAPAADEAVEETPVADETTANESGLVEIVKQEATVTAPLMDADVNVDYRILHLDCGRKYFSAAWIKALINEMAAAGYNQLQLAFGNDGLRFLLDDMSVTVNGTTYSDADVTAGIQLGNNNYYDAGDVNELTEAEMDGIIAHAKAAGIEIVPHVNMPGHMDAILDAIEYVGISDAHFTGYTESARSIDLENDTAVAFAQALLAKYVDYFDSKGCNFFHIGADEYANDAYNGGMGFAVISSSLYAKWVAFVQNCASIVKAAGMTPRAWNDGFYYGSYTTNIGTDIQLTYWTPGWGSGYDLEPASSLEDYGHDMINTHGDYYFVLESTGIKNPSDTALDFDNTAFFGSTVDDPIGSMFCIWCDAPATATEQEVAAAVRITLRKMAASMKNTDTYSEAVVSGGFNADGSINADETEDCTEVTLTKNSVSVTACGLTGLTVDETTAPTIEGASSVLAWNITPATAEGNYTGSATVSVPVPAEWTNVRGGVLASANGEEKLGITGELKDGYFTFTAPHFSTTVVYNLDANAIDYDEEIVLDVGGTHEIVIEDATYDGEITTDPAGIATVTAKYEQTSGIGESVVTSITANNAYYLKNESGEYMKADGTFTSDISAAVAWTFYYSFSDYYSISYNNTNLYYDTVSKTWTPIAGKVYDYYRLSNGTLDAYYEDIPTLTPVEITASGSADQSTITFAGVSAGTTYATVGDTTYKIVVHGTVELTITYVDADGNVIKSEKVSVRDDATSVTLSNFNYNDKYYVVEDTTLDITPATVTEYTVTVTETEEDLSAVASLTIEYWQTNGVVVETVGSTVSSKTISALDAYSEAGLDVNTLVPQNAYKETGTAVVYWRSRLLPLPDNQQTVDSGDDETLNGTGFTKIRYWNGSWAVYTEENEWLNIELDDYQLVAYYMNDMNLADEVRVGTSDWGKKGDGTNASEYLGSDHVSIAFQVVYEDGTTAPASTSAEDLASYTYLVDRNTIRGVGTIAINQIGDYQIWKVTAETGTHETNYSMWGSTTVKSFTWDDQNETTVWEGDPVSEYTIVNPRNDPSTEGAYANLTWDEENEVILIRIYLKTVETEDSLKVVYYDEKFGDTLYTYYISVPNGSNFNDNIVLADTTTIQDPGVFVDSDGNEVTDRINVTGYGIVNALDKTQNFQTDLTQVPQAVGKYKSELYSYTGSEIKDDGKTLYLYYNINTSVLSPNFVVDFGLPFTFNLSDVTNTSDLVESVTASARYGTVVYDSGKKTFTYTPTSVLQNVDVLSINILFDGASAATLSNVGVTPATTVHYEASFLQNHNGWSKVTTSNAAQTAEVLGSKVNNFGYEPGYTGGSASTASTIGSTTDFTFTGTGVDIYANCLSGTGYVSVRVKSATTGKTYLVNTVAVDGKSVATTGQTTINDAPIVSARDMAYGTYTVTITKVMDSNPVQISGFRVHGTIQEAAGTNSVFYADKEDHPDFYELRDEVLAAATVGDTTSQDYGTVTEMAKQVYSVLSSEDAAVVVGPTYSDGYTVQDLLDKGPKNELLLHAGSTLIFSVTTARDVQVGLKAPNGDTSYKITGATEVSGDIKTSVDMFYDMGVTPGTEKSYTFTITNTGSNLLSVTLLKICDDPSFAFTALTEDSIESALLAMGYTDAETEPTEPETEPTEPETEPTEPETEPTEPEVEETTKPTKPTKPSKPTKPGKGDKEDKEETAKTATLKITFVNLFGKKVGTATITKEVSNSGYCMISASDIRAQAPAGRRVLWFAPAIVPAGRTVSIIVPVI